MLIQIIPTILCTDERECLRRLSLIEPAVNWIHIDVMDGTLTKETCWHEPAALLEHRYNLFYELHLMVKDPMPIIDAWRRVSGFKRAIIHAEIPKKIGHMITEIRKRHLEAGIAISPQTPLAKIKPFLKKLDGGVLVIGGKIGKSGQKWNPKTLKTVQELRKLCPKMPIGFDIGVNTKTIPLIVRAGANRICSGKAIFKSPSPLRAAITLQSIAEHSVGL